MCATVRRSITVQGNEYRGGPGGPSTGLYGPVVASHDLIHRVPGNKVSNDSRSFSGLAKQLLGQHFFLASEDFVTNKIRPDSQKHSGSKTLLNQMLWLNQSWFGMFLVRFVLDTRKNFPNGEHFRKECASGAKLFS